MHYNEDLWCSKHESKQVFRNAELDALASQLTVMQESNTVAASFAHAVQNPGYTVTLSA